MSHGSNDRDRSLFLVRHADAGDPSEWIGPESQRPLSEKGIRQASRLAAVLLDSKLHIDAIRTSPARRCAETAAIIATALDVDAAVDDQLASGPTAVQLQELFGANSKIRKLMIVGHEPPLAALVATLTGIRNISIEKGAALRIDLSREVTEGSGRLVWFAPPALLRAPKRDR